MAERPSLNERWEKGMPHDPRSVALFKHIEDLDLKQGSDFFHFKSGGDGDNGEHLMFLMDDYFASVDEKKTGYQYDGDHEWSGFPQPHPRQAEFEAVAKKAVLDTIEHLDYYSACPFCEAGADDDGVGTQHSEECSFHGFDRTSDIEELEAWAHTLEGSDK